MKKPHVATGDDLAESLAWALANVPEKAETAAGLFCPHCDGNAKDGGFITSPISHKDTCPYRRAHLLLDLWKIQKLREQQERERYGCQP